MTSSQLQQHIKTLKQVFKEKSFLKICLSVKNYLKEKNIKEISAIKLSEISGLSKKESLYVLKKLNSDLFSKKSEK